MVIIHPVDLLVRQYLQSLDPEQLSVPAVEILRRPEIQARIFDDMFREAAMNYSPPRRYQFRVLKRLVHALEDAIEDPEEDVRSLHLRDSIL